MKVQSNYRIVVTPWNSLYEPTMRDTNALYEQIKRHCDFDGIHIEWDDVCEFCKCEWEEEKDGTPVCCNKAIEEFEKNKCV